MRIKQIELTGFKSFVERTVLELPAGVTGIVGPNGCGKSNIVDAIRWVLGEQSPKHLRGASMEDVIFAGNAQKGPLGMAEVSLLLERSEEDLAATLGTDDEALEASLGGLPPELARATEILVTRRYFRSGESEYFINRAPCRLRDITELFLGTGVGSKAYAIIEQGRVEQLVSAKPEEMRLFIEEAAGTTRFRARRLAAERKMERTRENLRRVQDVLQEQQRQMASLQRQAKRAEEYHRLKGELRDLDLRLFAARQRQLGEETASLERQIAEGREREESLQAEIERLMAAASDGRRRRAATEERLRELDEAATESRVALADEQARGRGLVDRVEAAEARRVRVGEELNLLTSRVEEEARETERGRGLLLELEAAERDALAREAAAAAALEAVVGDGPRLERALEEGKDALVAAVAEEARLRNMDEALQRRHEELEGQQRELEREQQVLGGRLEANGQARESTRGTLEALAQRRVALDEQLAALAADRDVVEMELQEAAARTEEARAQATQLRSRAESLRELQQRAEGCRRGAATLLREGSGARLLLADVLRVDPALERAVAVALGVRLGDVVVETSADAVEAIRWLEDNEGGSATVLPREPDRRAPAIVPSGRRLLDAIEVDPAHWALAESLLGGVLLADDLDAAMAAWRAADRAVMVVTREGQAIDAAGGISGGSEPPLEETLLARGRELRALERDVARADEALAACEGVALQRRARVRAVTDAFERAVADRESIRLQHLAAEKDRDRLDEEHARLTAELEVGALQASGLAGADGALAGEIAQLGESRRRAETEVGQRRDQVAAAQEALAAWRRGYAAVEEDRRRAAVEAAAVGERRRAQAQATEAHARSVEELRSRLVVLRGDVETAAQEALAARAEGVQVEARCAELQERTERLAAERAAVRETLAAMAEEATAEDEDERRVRQALEDGRAERSARELALAERRLELEHVLDRLHERYGLGAVALEEVEVGVEPPGEAERMRAEELRGRLVRLGDVNPAALEELQEVTERHAFLEAQRSDLERSLADLQHTIASLARTCRRRFQETFEAANLKLAEVFPKLFPGGKARLERVAVEDDEEGGVEIVVQPAGKKLQSLALLSGGEKALTATALVFSLFLIRPTPFCLLDEVDAPLDEANIGRFNQMIREMAERSQFVLVTHNRRTMEGADSLYGITMEQAGVSKVVSVRLNEAA